MAKITLAALAAVCVMSLAGCGATTALQTQEFAASSTQAAVSKANDALTDYGIAKGIAQVAETGLSLVGQPLAADALGGLINAADSKAAELQTAVDATTKDAAAIQALVTDFDAQIQALRLKAAPAVKVVPSVGTPAS